MQVMQKYNRPRPTPTNLHLSERSPLKTRVALGETSNGVLVCGPCLATTSVSAEITKGANDFRWALEELHTETTGDVEWNVAMHQPGTGVVSWEADDEISTSVGSVCITADWVGEVESCSSTASSTISNDPEIVAVKMDRMWQWGVVLDEPECPSSTGDGETIVIGWESVCSVENVAQRWCQPRNVNSLAVNLPEDACLGVKSKIKSSWSNAWRWNCGADVGNDLRLLNATSGEVECGGGWVTGSGACICEDGTLGISVGGLGVGTIALSTTSSCAEPVVASWLVSVDDNFISLSDGNDERVGGVRLNWHEVGGNNCEWMAIEGDVDVLVDASVHES